MKSMMWRTTLREIKGSFGRYMAIFSIIALGVGFFAGLKVTKPIMVKIVDNYMDDQQLFDYRLLCSLGFEAEDLEAFCALDGVRAAEGALFTDVIYRNGDEGTNLVASVHSITENVNQFKITAGRMPQAPDECVVDANIFSEDAIGTQIILAQENKEETLELMAYDTYTIGGVGLSPTYMNFQRGSTSIGNGVVNCFIYIPIEGFEADYYSEIYIKMDVDEPLYSQAYDDYIEVHEDGMEEALIAQTDRRQNAIVQEAQAEIDDAQEELNAACEEALAKLTEAKNELESAQSELDESLSQLQTQESALQDAVTQLQDGLGQIDSALPQLEEGIAQIQAVLSQMPDETLQQTFSDLTMQRDALIAQRAVLE